MLRLPSPSNACSEYGRRRSSAMAKPQRKQLQFFTGFYRRTSGRSILLGFLPAHLVERVCIVQGKEVQLLRGRCSARTNVTAPLQSARHGAVRPHPGPVSRPVSPACSPASLPVPAPRTVFIDTPGCRSYALVRRCVTSPDPPCTTSHRSRSPFWQPVAVRRTVAGGRVSSGNSETLPAFPKHSRFPSRNSFPSRGAARGISF